MLRNLISTLSYVIREVMLNIPLNTYIKLGEMGSENGTWLRFMKSTLDPLYKLPQNLQGEKGVGVS